jgi:hypothetical protein
LCADEAWALGEVDQKHLEKFLNVELEEDVGD